MTSWLRPLACTFLIAGIIAVARGEPPPAPDKDGLDDLISTGKKPDANRAGQKKAPDKDDVDELLKGLDDKPSKKSGKPEPGKSDPDPKSPKTPEIKKSANKPATPAPPAARGKWLLYKYYDQLGLSDDQKDRVTRVAEFYDPKINNVKSKIAMCAGKPVVGASLIPLSVMVRKLINDRQKLLDKILTEEQREKYRQLSGGK